MLLLGLEVKTLFFIFNKGFHGNVRGHEFLDMALMAAAFDQKVVILFEGEAVNALVKNQQPENIALKNITPILKALPLYDINDVFVEKESMDQWGLVKEQLTIETTLVSRHEVVEQLNAAHHVFSI